MEGKIIFNKNNNVIDFLLNKEKPFFKITHIEIPSIPRGSQNMYSLIPQVKITYIVNDIFQGSTNTTLRDIKSLISPNQVDAKFKVDEIVSSSADQVNIKFNFFNDSELDQDIILHYTQFEHKVDIKKSSEDFNTHFTCSDNVKILFSAPFGQGKTTFLNLFFEANQDKYEVFKLYPVNYSVSHNEDIFKYIKAEILFQLMGKDVEFDKEKFSYLETAPAFFKKNVHNILSPFIGLLPLIGKSAADIYEKLYKLGVEYLDYHSELKIDDKKKAIEFINELYEKEGSIFEDNFYTQLIKQLLEQHKQKYNKQNVLVIDDIDRMDPDHIFRIFNVFSAHFDSNDFNNGHSNKFGFDKIILVCDYENIKKLFRHRYGSSAAFDGYLGKYYSRSPHYYNNVKEIEVLIDKIVYGNRTNNRSYLENALMIILSDFISTNEITLRDLLKLQKYDFLTTVNQLATVNSIKLRSPKHRFLFFNIISFLENIFDIDTIKEKISRCKSEIKFRERVNYSHYTGIGLVPLANFGSESIANKNVSFKGKPINFNIQETTDRHINYDYYEPKDLLNVGNSDPIIFDIKDFYEVLLLNVDKYKES